MKFTCLKWLQTIVIAALLSLTFSSASSAVEKSGALQQNDVTEVSSEVRGTSDEQNTTNTSDVEKESAKKFAELWQFCRNLPKGHQEKLEHCKKQCAGGDKRFCACANNPCIKYTGTDNGPYGCRRDGNVFYCDRNDLSVSGYRCQQEKFHSYCTSGYNPKAPKIVCEQREESNKKPYQCQTEEKVCRTDGSVLYCNSSLFPGSNYTCQKDGDVHYCTSRADPSLPRLACKLRFNGRVYECRKELAPTCRRDGGTLYCDREAFPPSGYRCTQDGANHYCTSLSNTDTLRLICKARPNGTVYECKTESRPQQNGSCRLDGNILYCDREAFPPSGYRCVQDGAHYCTLVSNPNAPRLICQPRPDGTVYECRKELR